MSWTFNEYDLLLKGSKHARIDELERMSISAIWTAKAGNERRISAKKLFNAEKEHAKVDNPENKEEKVQEMIKLNEAFKGFTPEFRKKGG
jgi:hypothetical protein